MGIKVPSMIISAVEDQRRRASALRDAAACCCSPNLGLPCLTSPHLTSPVLAGAPGRENTKDVDTFELLRKRHSLTCISVSTMNFSCHL